VGFRGRAAQVAAEPVDGAVGGVVEGAGLAEEVVGAGHAVPILGALQQVVGLVQAVRASSCSPAITRVGQLTWRSGAMPARPGRPPRQTRAPTISGSFATARTAAALPVPLATRPTGSSARGGWWRSHSNTAPIRVPSSGAL
jgi:hypothetical protein